MNIKIIDHSTLIPGPFATYLLQNNLGARVVKVEDSNQKDPLAFLRPTKDGVGLGYQAINSKKELVKVDFRQNGIDQIKELVKDAGVFVENYKPGRTFKLGIAFEDLVKINSKLIYVSIVGFPQGHPLEKRSAHDLNILAMSGYLDQQNNYGKNTAPPPLVLADMFTAYTVSNKIMACLLNGQTGIHLTISIWEAFCEAMLLNNFPQIQTQAQMSPADALMSGLYPCYHIYQAKDGLVAVAALETPLWVDFCSHINRPDLANSQYEQSSIEQISKIILATSKFDWLENDFCVSPVLTILESEKLNYAKT